MIRLLAKRQRSAHGRNLIGAGHRFSSADGLANARAIAEVPGVDALFIGRADLALTMGLEDIRVAAVTEATQATIAAARAAGKIAAMFVPNVAKREQFVAAGATCVVVGSDQSLMHQGPLAMMAGNTPS